jgi:DivIVA domain-containing protein
MPLTPEDVHKKTFTPVRLREGYDMGEVDQFLDEVEAELIRLHQDNDDLRHTLSGSSGAPAVVPPIAHEASPSEAPPAATEAEPVGEPVPVSEVPQQPVVMTVPEASSAATRLLELATNNADQLVGEAKDQADKILGEARTEADRVQSEARARAEVLDAETAERRGQLLGQLESDKVSVAQELEDLRAFEREYRSRLKGYFQAQLSALDGADDVAVPLTPAADGETPGRLRELLGEDQPT